jgi:adenine phosphoribosyltransferase
VPDRLFVELIRDVPDFPKPGVIFKDITPVLADPVAFSELVDELCAPYRPGEVSKVAGIEARGFILATPVAEQLGAGFVPIRKPGKLPAEVIRETYELEYGTDALEMHRDALQPGDRVLIVDDVLATGGTAAAAIRLVERLDARVVGVAVFIELGFLGGRSSLNGTALHALVTYD